ncbi:MAG: TlpA disulfide reductase family protein [Nakamurella sp.]
MRRILAAVTTALALVVSGCTSNATAIPGQGSFVFVSPGAKKVYEYPAGTRGTVGDFTGTSVTDAQQTIKLSDYPNTIMVLNVWGSWCGPCRGEAPDLNVAAELSADRPVQFLGINVQDAREPAADFIANFQVLFPSIFDPTTRTLLSIQNFPTSAIPTTIILDREHKVARIFLREVSAQELDEAVVAIVDEGGAGAADSTAAADPGVPSSADPTAPTS